MSQMKYQTFSSRVKLALEKAKTIEDIEYIQEKVDTTDEINRRTIAGRELTKELSELITETIKSNGIMPF